MKLTQDESKERNAAYKEAEVAHFLITLTETGGELKPKYDSVHGYRYPEIESMTGKNSEETEKFLRKLAKLGILDEKVTDMALYCPSCGTANISTNYLCPFCGSPQIIRNALIEHLSCGYINTLPQFKVDKNLVCPKCKTELKRADIRSAGRWYECANCKKRIANVQPIHTCRNCGEKFDFNDAKYFEAYTYSISETAKSEITKGVLFPFFLEKLLKELNYEVQIPGKIAGSSGIDQEFDVVVKTDENKLLAVDVLFYTNVVTKQQIIREYEKIFDTKAEVFIVAHSFDGDAKKLVKDYKLKIIQASPAIALSKLDRLLSRGKKRKLQKKKTEPDKATEKIPESQKTQGNKTQSKTMKIGGFFKRHKT